MNEDDSRDQLLKLVRLIEHHSAMRNRFAEKMAKYNRFYEKEKETIAFLEKVYEKIK